MQKCGSIANSEERIIALARGWLRALSRRKLAFSVQYHADQNLEEIRRFWGAHLGIDAYTIRLLRKANSGQLKGRSCVRHTACLLWLPTTPTFAHGYRRGSTVSARIGL